MDPACQRHRALCVCFPEAPCWPALPLLVNDSLIRCEISWGLWHTVRREIPRRPQNKPPTTADLSPDRRQVAQRSHSQRDIDPRTNQIDIAVLQQDVDIERRMVGEKLWQV